MLKIFKNKNKFYNFLLLLVFIIAIYLRTKVYITNQSFWHDECALAWNILNHSYLELFQPLRFLQSAPVLFLICTKFLVNLFKTNELVFRFLPYLSSLLALACFYVLSKKLFNSKLAVFLANLSFATCFPLYYYASEFKPYSSDVLICILTILIFLNLKEKNLLIYSLILSIFLWFSFPFVFLLAALTFLVILDKTFSIKSKILFLIPQIINALIFCKTFFINMYLTQKSGMTTYWNNEFLNIHNFKHLIQNYFNFTFIEGQILLLLTFLGIVFFIKEHNKFFKFVLTLFLILICASVFKIYPLSGRLILFLVPIIILLTIKPFDNKSKLRFICLIVFLCGIFPQLKNTYKTISVNNYVKNNPNPREMMSYMASQIKDKDIIYVNTESNSDYLYYNQIYKIKNKELIATPQYIKLYDNVWFFLPNNADSTVEGIVNNNYEIIYENKKESSTLIYAKKIK